MVTRGVARWWIAAALCACGGADEGTGSATTSAGTTDAPPATTGGDATSLDPGTSAPTSTATAASTSTSNPTTPTTDDPGATTTTAGDTTGDTGDETGPAIVCADDCHYVRAGAAGGGGDWSDALPALPDALERGHTYFVAAGDYPAYTFDDPESGDLPIRVVRAAVDEHGTDVGWDPGYADGLASFGELAFTTGHHDVDGRGAARAVGGFQSTVVSIAADAVAFRGFDVDGAFATTADKHTGGACTGMSITGDGAVVVGNRIHDAADDGVAMAGVTDLEFRGNVVHALHGCGTDGGCGPCYNGHSDGLELYDVADSAIVGNMVYDVASTSAVFFGNWADELGMGPSEYCENILLANNILYSPQTGFVAYFEDVRGLRALHNVMWGLHMGAYGGLSIGTHVEDLDLYNNAILSINYKHVGGTHDPVEHRGDHNLFAYSLGQWVDGPHDVVAVDPLFAAIPGGEGPIVDAPAPADFTPQAQSPLRDAGFPGSPDLVLPPTDFFGVARDDSPNLGAIE